MELTIHNVTSVTRERVAVKGDVDEGDATWTAVVVRTEDGQEFELTLFHAEGLEKLVWKKRRR